MPDHPPSTPPPPPDDDDSELPPRWRAKLKLEVEGYELLDRIGEGGQAAVYRAIQKQDGRMVAIKILHAGPHATDEARARLKRETAALRALNHPNIVHAVAAGRTRSGLDCLVMNFVEGRPLDALWEDDAFAATVTPEPPPPPAARLRLFKQICETVQAAHRKGITHRDLSPSNILIDGRGQAHILDFGMASTAFDGIVGRNVTVTGQFIGKLKYASPEQARGAGAKESPEGNVDIRSDVYALGVMLYQLLTNGAFPYEVVGNVIDVLNNIIHSKPRPPSELVAGMRTPKAAASAAKAASPARPAAPIRRNPPLVNETIEAIVLKALEKDPEKRYQSAGELAADIDRYLAGQPTSAVVWTKRPKAASKFSIRRRAILAVASLFLIAALVGVTMNARIIAVWLGLSTVAAPILPTDHLPLAPRAADAGMPEAAQPEGGVAALNRVAEDLARVEAKLLAVNKQLNAVDGSIKSPELDLAAAPPPPAAPLAYEAFITKLCENAKAAGKPLAIDATSGAEFDRQVKEESDAISGELEKETLLTLRRTLDAQQAVLWARLAFGAFAARDIGVQLIYTFKFKEALAADENAAEAALRKRHVLDAGVRAVRWIDLALGEASATLKQDGSESPSISVGDASDAAGRQLDEPLKKLRVAVNSAGAASGVQDADVEMCGQLGERAQNILDSLGGVKDLAERVSRAANESERSRRRSELQKDLLAAVDAASRLDQGLAAAVKEWKAEVSGNKLPAVASAVAARPKAEKGTQPEENIASVQDIADIFPQGSMWTGDYFATDPGPSARLTAKIISVQGGLATMEWTNQNGRWQSHLQLSGGRVVLIDCVGIDSNVNTPNILVFEGINIGGAAPAAKDPRQIKLEGSWSVRHKRGDLAVKEYQSRWELKRSDQENGAKFVVGDIWNGTWTDDRGDYAATASITEIDGQRITLHVIPSFNSDGYYITFAISGGKNVSITKFISGMTVKPSGFRPLSSQGTIVDGVLNASVRAERTGAKGDKGVSTWKFSGFRKTAR